MQSRIASKPRPMRVREPHERLGLMIRNICERFSSMERREHGRFKLPGLSHFARSLTPLAWRLKPARLQALGEATALR